MGLHDIVFEVGALSHAYVGVDGRVVVWSGEVEIQTCS